MWTSLYLRTHLELLHLGVQLLHLRLELLHLLAAAAALGLVRLRAKHEQVITCRTYARMTLCRRGARSETAKAAAHGGVEGGRVHQARGLVVGEHEGPLPQAQLLQALVEDAAGGLHKVCQSNGQNKEVNE